MSVISAQKIFYYEHLFFSKKLQEVKHTVRNIAGHNRYIPIGLGLPPAHWPQYTEAFEKSNYYLTSNNSAATHTQPLFSEINLDQNALEFLALSFTDQFLAQQTIALPN